MSEPTGNVGSSEFNSTGRRRQLLPITAIVLALVAVGLSAWAVFRPSPNGSSHTDAERAEAKGKLCTATDVVRTGISVNTNLQPPGGPSDVTGSLAVAANARIALYGGGQYLLSQIDPATPQDLAESVRKFAVILTDIGAAATAGQKNSDPHQAERLRQVDALNATISELCK
jgi:hypothetical protein